jgi:hypothetical protein
MSDLSESNTHRETAKETSAELDAYYADKTGLIIRKQLQ